MHSVVTTRSTLLFKIKRCFMQEAKDITALEAWDILNKNSKSVLVDTRTKEEWASYGSPKIDGNKILRISSHLSPNMQPNIDFINELNKQIPNKDLDLIFMCKTSGRSRIAAQLAILNGYHNCYVVIDGYQGSQAGPGWYNSNLPSEIIC